MATAAVLLIVLVAVPIRLWHYRQNADLTGLMIGVRGEAAVVDNVAYYATEPRSGWFISASTRVIEMPLRATDDSAAPCRVHVAIDGRRVNTVTVPAREWSTTVLELPGDGHGRKSSLLAFDVESPDCALMVGRFISR